MTGPEAAEMGFLRSVQGYTRLDKISKVIRKELQIPISGPTDVTCDRFLFSIYMCITVHVSSVKRSSSGVPHRTYSLQFLCLCLSAVLSCKKTLFVCIYFLSLFGVYKFNVSWSVHLHIFQ
jgi:hypothetical protein